MPTGFLAARAAEVADRERTRAQRTQRTRAARATDPEHCRAPGRTLARPAHWPEEDPAWTDWTYPVVAQRPDHKATRGKRRGRFCPDCREQRSRHGECWCGSESGGTDQRGRSLPAPRTRAARALPPETMEPRWASAHRRMHPRPLDTCDRCAVAHA